MPEFKSVIELSRLDSQTGFVIVGPQAYDNFGSSVASIGDLNSDGFADFIIGAALTDPDGANRDLNYGASYVFFGSAKFESGLSTSNLNGSNGFRIEGDTPQGYSGTRVSSAGDLNGDGFDDIAIAGSTNLGVVRIVFGSRFTTVATLNVSDLNGTNGFNIRDADILDSLGGAICPAGDVNGDGQDDIVITAPTANRDSEGRNSGGASFVLFGHKGQWEANIDVSQLNGTNGFRINSSASEDYLGLSVSSAGDINGDGIDDIIIGALGDSPQFEFKAPSYILFGTAQGFSSRINVSSLDGKNGFKIDNLHLYQGAAGSACVSSAGDLNADGYDDVVVCAQDLNSELKGFVIFGKSTGFDSTFDVGGLDGKNGFRIDTGVPAETTGYQIVSSAGDVNGDGFADILLGASRWVGLNSVATAYVIFGKATGFPSSIHLSSLDGKNGFEINGPSEINGRTNTDSQIDSVSLAGDINNDGFTDLLVGSREPAYSHGESYIIYGHRADTAVLRIGTDIDNRINGGKGADTISGLGGDDVLIGWEDNDAIDGGTGNDTINAGRGNDTIAASDGIDLYDGSADRDTLSFADFSNKLLFADLAAGTFRFTTSTGQAVTSAIVNIENLTGTGQAERLYGDESGNILSGAGGGDTIIGGDGNDLLIGGTGRDRMVGGLGNDSYYVDTAGERTIDGTGQGSDTVYSSVSTELAANIENLTLVGAAVINGRGNDLANRIVGSTAANTLNGFGGADTMAGGAGEDTYVVDTAGDIVLEGKHGGKADTIMSTVTYILPENVENLTLIGSGAIDGTGNAGHNAVNGNVASNALSGLDGYDSLDGSGGNDTLMGGAGADKFLFTTALANNVDSILDFNSADDTILLSSAIFTGLATGQLNASAFFVGTAAADIDDRIIYNSANGAVLYDADGTGVAAPIQFAKLGIGLPLSNVEFIVV